MKSDVVPHLGDPTESESDGADTGVHLLDNIGTLCHPEIGLLACWESNLIACQNDGGGWTADVQAVATIR